MGQEFRTGPGVIPPRGTSPGAIPDRAKSRKVIEVVGKTGTGKSFLFKSRILPYYNRAVMATPTDETYPHAWEFTDDSRMAIFAAENKVCRVLKRGQTQEDIAMSAGLALALGNCAFVADEAQQYFPSYDRTLLPVFEELIFRSRHRCVDVILIHQRAAMVNINIRSQWTELISFQQTEADDCDWLRKQSGDPLRHLETLPTGYYYHITKYGTRLKNLPEIS